MRTLIGGLVAAALLTGNGMAMGQEAQPAKPDAGTTPTSTPTTTPAAAPESAPAAAPQAPRAQAMFTIHGEHTFEADLDNSPGSVGIDRAGADLSMRFPVGDRSRLSATLATELSFYNFKNASGFGAGVTEPWDDTIEMNGSLTFSTQATRQWSWYVGGGVDDSIQRGADYGDGLTGGFFGGLNYAVSEKLSFGFGLLFRSQLENNGEILPIPSVDWQISDQWRLGTHSNVAGNGLTLSYQPMERLTLSLDATNEDRSFRLDNTAAAPNGVARDHRIPITFGAAWNVSHQVAISGRAGVEAYQEYTLVDENSNNIAKVKTKPAMLLGLSITISF
jgi:hypothetical protein